MHGIPKEIAPWMSYVGDETIRFMLEYNGVKEFRSRITFEREGTKEGRELTAIHTAMQWR
jgi:hypothetical protein